MSIQSEQAGMLAYQISMLRGELAVALKQKDKAYAQSIREEIADLQKKRSKLTSKFGFTQ